jgi:energy-coupling factor transporter ATP-binding protein EcfA2
MSNEHKPKPERPIDSSKHDDLDRHGFVVRLASGLVDFYTGKSTGVVVGLTGPWGSGKSSILNLLQEHLENGDSSVIVVRFDPWLISGRDDLITQFIRQLLSTLRGPSKKNAKLKKVIKSIANYGARLSPIADLLMPGAGTTAKAGASTLVKALTDTSDLFKLRKQLDDELEKAKIPIVVMIDEIDRVEDSEIRSIAQLVRAVADFRSISYVLAYDVDRVALALGSGADKKEKSKSGREYLEKIVQLQIPLPISFGEEILDLLNAALKPIHEELGVKSTALMESRYSKLTNILLEGVLETPRDVKRLIGTFHSVYAMIRGEVDWIDTLGYCALLTKAPQALENIKKHPDLALSNPVSHYALTRRLRHHSEKADDEEIFIDVFGSQSEPIRALIGLLFPAFAKTYDDRTDYEDPVSERRPLLFLLRLGMPPRGVKRIEIELLLAMSERDITKKLQTEFEGNRFDNFYDCLTEIYIHSSDIDHRKFWNGVREFLRKRSNSWPTQYEEMHEVSRNFADVFRAFFRKGKNGRIVAQEIFKEWIAEDDLTLLPYLLRSHIFTHGLFGNAQNDRDFAILDRKETEETSVEYSKKWRGLHLKNELITCRWDLQPVYTMVDTKHWDDDCRNLLVSELERDEVVDGLALLLFGGNYAVDRSFVDKLCGWDTFEKRAKSRLKSISEKPAHPTAVLALNRAIGHAW